MTAGDTYTIVISTYSPGTALSLPMDFFSTGSGSLVFTVVADEQFQPVSGSLNLGAAVVLDSLVGNATGDMGNVLNTLLALPESERAAVLNRLIPISSHAVVQTSAQATGAALGTVSQRISTLRSDSGLLVNGFAYMPAGIFLGDELLKPKRSLWVQGMGFWNDQEDNADYAGYNSTTTGLTVGMDQAIWESITMGVAASFSRSDIDMSGIRKNDSTDVDSYQATLYTTFDLERVWVDSMVAYSTHQYKSSRDTTTNGIAKGDFDGNQLTCRLTLGMPLEIRENVTLTPSVGGEWSRMEQDAYEETGAGPLSLAVESTSASRIKSIVGAELKGRYSHGQDLNIISSLYLGWSHDFDNDGIDSVARFSGGGSSYITPGQSIPEDTFNLTMGLAFNWQDKYELNLTAQGEKADDYQGMGGAFKCIWWF